MTTVETHCKDVDHLAVRVIPARVSDRVTATFLTPMPCHNRPNEEPWGIVISKRTAYPLKGVHLRPAAVAWLPGQLRAAATECTINQSVELAHTVGGHFVHFIALSATTATRLADAIEAATPQPS